MPNGTAAADRTRELLSHPDRVATVLWTAGVLAVASVIPLRDWPTPALVSLFIAMGVAGVCGGLRATVGAQLPRWSMEVEVGIANLLVSVVSAAGTSVHLRLSNLYLLIALFAVLYLPFRAALVHIGSAGAAYALVLAFGPTPTEPRVVAWASVFGTVAVCGAVVIGLVSMLRLTAMQDTLTGLANRRAWDERLEADMQRSRRTGAALSVAMIDLNGFKAVNDQGGHEAGDCLLQNLAHSWQAVVRSGGDFVARVGGDEFAVLAPGSDATGIDRLAERLSDVAPDGVSWSIGTATWNGTERAEDLLRRADGAMYEAKLRRRRADQLDRA